MGCADPTLPAEAVKLELLRAWFLPLANQKLLLSDALNIEPSGFTAWLSFFASEF